MIVNLGIVSSINTINILILSFTYSNTSNHYYMHVITLITNVYLDIDLNTPMWSFLVFSCSNEEAEAENQILCLIHTALKVIACITT